MKADLHLLSILFLRCLTLRSGGQLFSQLERPPAVIGKDVLAALFLRPGVKAGGKIFRIVAELVCVRGQQKLTVPENPAQGSLGRGEGFVVAEGRQKLFGAVHGIDQPDLHPAGENGSVVGSVGEKGKEKTLQKAPHFTGFGAEVHRGSQEKDVCPGGFFQDGGQPVVDGAPAVTFAADFFAGEAADAPFEVVVVEVYQLGFGAVCCGPCQGVLKQFCRIPCFSGAAVDCDRFHVVRSFMYR